MTRRRLRDVPDVMTRYRRRGKSDTRTILLRQNETRRVLRHIYDVPLPINFYSTCYVLRYYIDNLGEVAQPKVQPIDVTNINATDIIPVIDTIVAHRPGCCFTAVIKHGLQMYLTVFTLENKTPHKATIPLVDISCTWKLSITVPVHNVNLPLAPCRDASSGNWKFARNSAIGEQETGSYCRKRNRSGSFPEPV